MKLCCIADLHGYLPNLNIGNNCDVILIAGDISSLDSPYKQRIWLLKAFNDWLRRIQIPVIFCGGNHDWNFMNYEVVSMLKENKNAFYLQDDLIEFNGYKIWGTPWSLQFNNWCFNLTEVELQRRWDLIPVVDILLCHSPPYGIGDNVSGELIGSKSLTLKIKELKPRLVIFGHNHGGYGAYTLGNTKLFNCSLRDDHYNIVNKPIYITL